MKKVGKILAEGEVTGHVHTLQDTEVLEREDGVREFKAEKEEILTHHEHKPIVLPAKEYESDRVVETDHFADEARRVVD